MDDLQKRRYRPSWTPLTGLNMRKKGVRSAAVAGKLFYKPSV